MTSKEITKILNQISDGDNDALKDLIPVVYDQMKQIASNHVRSEGGQKVEPTELVHEAYIKLVGNQKLAWKSRSHFFGACATVIRRILVDLARARKAAKRGGGQVELTWDDNLMVPADSIDLVELDAALQELQELAPRQVQLIELRYFGGMSEVEATEVLNVSRRTVSSDWAMAKAWLKTRLG